MAATDAQGRRPHCHLIPSVLQGNVRERLHKIIAARGLTSRRKAEEWIAAGYVSVNGKTVTLPGAKADPETDQILVKGRPLPPAPATRVLMLNKPVGYVCTSRKSREQSPSIFELVPSGERLFTVGRLDRDTTGLLLLTNSGELALRLTHPRYGTPKEYEVETAQPVTAEQVRRLRAGIELEDGPAVPLRVEKINARKLRLVLTEGRKRQVRRMMRALNAHVVSLNRTAIGCLRLANLPPGAYRALTSREVRLLHCSPSFLSASNSSQRRHDHVPRGRGKTHHP